MVIYIGHDQEVSQPQYLMSRGIMITQPNWKELVGKTIKHIQKIDGKIMLTLK